MTSINITSPINEGSLTTLIANVTDPDNATLSYEINWNDGSANTTGTIASGGTINENHTYTDNGVYTITLTVSDSSLSDTETFNITVNNVAPTVNAGADQSITEGDLVTINPSFTDQGADTHTATINWGDGNISNLGTVTSPFSANHTYPNNGTYIVTVNVTDDDNGFGQDTLSIIVNDATPNANFNYVPLSPIEGNQVNFTDTSTSYDPIASWSWTFDDGSNSTLQNPTHVYAQNRTYTVTLTVTDNDCSQSSISQNITITDTSPTAVLNANVTTIQEGQSIYFNASSSTGYDTPLTYFWDFNDSSTSTSAELSHQYNTNGTYTVTLTVTDSDGSQDSANVTITVDDLTPTANFSYAPVPAYENTTQVNFTDLSTGGDQPLSYFWNFGDGTNSTSQNPNHIYPNNGTYQVTLTVTDGDGSQNSISQNILVSDLGPTAQLSVASPISEGQNSTLDASASTSSPDEIIKYEWDFDYNGTFNNDFDSGLVSVISRQFNSNGTHAIAVRVTDSDGSTSISTAVLVVNDLGPTANFNYTPLNPQENQTISFNDLSASGPDAIVSWLWSFGNGNTSTAQNPVHQYNSNGTYTVTLTVTDADGSQDSYSINITVGDSTPTANFTVNATRITEGESIAFAGNSTGYDQPLVYFWLFGDGSNSTQQNPVHQYNSNGTYTVTLTVTDADGSYDSSNMTITVDDATPSADFNYIPSSPTEGEQVNFTDASSSYDPIASWSWTFGDGNISTVQNSTNIYIQNGTYVINLTVTDSDGSVSSVTQTITVLDTEPIASLSGDASLNEGQTGNYDAAGSTGYDKPLVYEWDWNYDGTFNPSGDTGATRSHQFVQDGIYHIAVRVTDADGSQDIANMSVIVNDSTPTANFTANTTTIIEGESVAFTDASTGYDTPFTYLWIFGDGGGSTVKNPDYQYSQNGTYIVTLTVTDADGDADSTQMTITVLDTEPTAILSAVPTTINEGETVNFSSIGSTAYDTPLSYFWSFGDGTNATGSEPNHTYSTMGEYLVILTLTDSDGSQDSDNTTITVLDITEPTVSIQSPVNNSYLNYSTVELNYTAIDNNAVSAVWYNLDNGTSISLSGNTTFNATEGAHVLYLYANDTSNNLASAQSLFVIDTTMPVLTDNSNITNNTLYNSNQWINVTVNDAGNVTVSIILDNQSVKNCTGSLSLICEYEVGGGVHTYYVNYTDQAGNNNQTQPITFEIDTQGPLLSIQSPANNTVYSLIDIDLLYTSTDSNNLSWCAYSLDGGNVIELVNCTNATLTNLADGSHNVTVYSNDSLGNSAKTSSYFTIDRSGMIVGYVYNNNSQPIQGVLIQVLQNSAVINITTSNSDGYYALYVGDGTFDIEVSKPGYQDVSVADIVVSGSIPTKQNITMYEISQGVSGYVNDQNNNPVNGTTLSFTSPTYNDSTITNESGYFNIELPPETYNVTLTKPGYLNITLVNITITNNSYLEFNITMIQTGSVQGTVKNWTGSEIGNTTIIVMQNGDMVKQTQTDANGTYSITGLAPGYYNISANAIGYIENSVKNIYLSSNETVTQDFWLFNAWDGNETYASWSGYVLDKNNQPIENATVIAVYNSTEHLINSTLTDANGFFNITVIPGVYTRLNITATGYRFYQTQILPNITGHHTLPFNITMRGYSGPGAVSGIVLDQNNHAVANAIIRMFQNNVEKYNTITNADGTYTITNTKEGIYRITVEADCYQSQSLEPLLVQSRETTTQNFAISAMALNIRGFVIGSDDSNKLQNVFLRLLRNGNTLYITQSDSNGSYVFNTTGGAYSLTAAKSGYMYYEEDISGVCGAYEHNISLTPTGKVVGEITNGNGASVKLKQGENVIAESTGAQISFTVPVGTYDLLVVKSGYHDYAQSDIEVAKHNTTDLGTITLSELPSSPPQGGGPGGGATTFYPGMGADIINKTNETEPGVPGGMGSETNETEPTEEPGKIVEPGEEPTEPTEKPGDLITGLFALGTGSILLGLIALAIIILLIIFYMILKSRRMQKK